MTIEIVDFPMKHGDCPYLTSDFPLNMVIYHDLPIKHADFPIKYGDFPVR